MVLAFQIYVAIALAKFILIMPMAPVSAVAMTRLHLKVREIRSCMASTVLYEFAFFVAFHIGLCIIWPYMLREEGPYFFLTYRKRPYMRSIVREFRQMSKEQSA